ncbi:MAG: hypothetical protein GXP52_06090 [Deltaproteobacteria bacterium]|nr:hypothetical protein [Deltaproteobacteria bacterium]
MNHADGRRRWYVIRAKPREEERCVRELSSSGIDAFCPMTKEYRWRRRKHEAVAFFPGYVFGRFHFPNDYYTVKWAKGVSNLIRFGENAPPSLDDSIIGFLRGRIDDDGFIDSAPEFKPGDPVRFRTGPFKDLAGTILRADTAEGRVMVLLDILYQAKVEVDTYQVQAI